MHPSDWLQSWLTGSSLCRSDKTADRFKCASIDDRGLLTWLVNLSACWLKQARGWMVSKEKKDAKTLKIEALNRPPGFSLAPKFSESTSRSLISSAGYLSPLCVIPITAGKSQNLFWMEKKIIEKRNNFWSFYGREGFCSNPGSEGGGDKGFCREASDWV